MTSSLSLLIFGGTLMALQGALGFLQFFGRGQAITFALPSWLLNPITLKSSLFCALPFPPFGKYYGNYARLHWLVKSETVPQGECHSGADCHGYTLLLQ